MSNKNNSKEMPPEPELPDGPLKPPKYTPVSFEDIEPEKYYFATQKIVGSKKGELPDYLDILFFMDGEYKSWKTKTHLNPVYIRGRKYNKVFDLDVLKDHVLVLDDGDEQPFDEDEQILKYENEVKEYDKKVITDEEYSEILNLSVESPDLYHTDANDAWRKLEYAKNNTGDYIFTKWGDEIVDMVFPIKRDLIKVNIEDNDGGYIFYNINVVPNNVKGGRRKRKTKRIKRRGKYLSRKNIKS